MEKYSERITFRADQERMRKLKFLAEKDMSSVGRIIRILIDKAYREAMTENANKKAE